MASDEGKNNRAPVLIMARHGKRGYLIEVAGSEPPQVYPCLTEEDIGEAIVEILNDPDRESVEFTAPKLDAASVPSRVEVEVSDEEGDEDEEVYEQDDEYHPPGWSATDELAMNLFGAITDKARKISRWRKDPE